MKIFLSYLLFACALTTAKAQSLDPSDVLKQDGVLRISDGSSYYEFNTNGTFRSFPVGISGRTFDGTWTSNADINLCHFIVKAKMGWMNGFGPTPDDWKIVFAVYSGTRKPAERMRLATFDCYWIIDELAKIPRPEPSLGSAFDRVQVGDTLWAGDCTLRISKRSGNELEGVSISKKLSNGKTNIFSGDTATLSSVPYARDNKSVLITLHNAKWNAGSGNVDLGGDYAIGLDE